MFSISCTHILTYLRKYKRKYKLCTQLKMKYNQNAKKYEFWSEIHYMITRTSESQSKQRHA